ncbi:metallophosphoesterase [Phaeovulum sp. W22_SRMD_FR3]|uniref:metallophosphoesterase n=1 Tax=Phaeovulum sp. W22_SRMD_FR3 TaxID=3240274 RepID=UPI003F956938
MKLLSSALQRFARPKAPAALARGILLDSTPARIYAVGDIHGEARLYRQLEQMILADMAMEAAPGAPAVTDAVVILLGDLIDRGPDSAALIDHLLAPAPRGLRRIVLRGNHEDMALRYLDNPTPDAAWLQHGGAETLASYGLAADERLGYGLPSRQMRMRLDVHLPEDHRAFLSQLPHFVQTPEYYFCHAGPEPDLGLTEQRPRTLMWSRGFADDNLAAPDGLGQRLVVHGHMPVTSPVLRDWRLNLDTGACFGGPLSAARLIPGQMPHVIAAQPGRTVQSPHFKVAPPAPDW